MNAPRAVIYARLSRSERRELDRGATAQISSLEDQVRTCSALAKDNGYEVVAEPFIDDGISAWSGKFRPAFLELTERIEAGDVDVVLAAEDSRLTRSVEEGVVLQATCVAAGSVWHTATGGRTDPSAAQDRMMATIKTSLDEYESAIKAARVRRSVQRRLDAGVDIGGPRPFGWEKNRRTIREDEAALLRRAYDAIVDGESVYHVTKHIFEASAMRPPRARNRVWRTQTVRHMLLSPRHKGHLVVKGMDYGKVFPEIVDSETWEAVRSRLSSPDRNKRRGAKDKYFVGIARCGRCGSRMGAASSADTRCRREGDRDAEGGHATIKQRMLEEEILKAMTAAFIFGRASDFETRSGATVEQSGLLSERERIGKAQQETIRDRNDGLVPREDARNELLRLKRRVDEIEVRLSEIQAQSAAAHVFAAASSEVFGGRTASFEKAAEVRAEIREAFLNLSVERQRELLESLIEVRVEPGKRGPRRVKIRHLVVTSLNEHE